LPDPPPTHRRELVGGWGVEWKERAAAAATWKEGRLPLLPLVRREEGGEREGARGRWACEGRGVRHGYATGELGHDPWGVGGCGWGVEWEGNPKLLYLYNQLVIRPNGLPLGHHLLR